MDYRSLAYSCRPWNMRTGAFAPAIMINASNAIDAAKIAVKESHLCKRYPDTWTISIQ